MVGLVLHKGMHGFFFRHTEERRLIRERERKGRKRERQGGRESLLTSVE